MELSVQLSYPGMSKEIYAQATFQCVFYKRQTARPATTATTGNIVSCAAPPLEVEELPVALDTLEVAFAEEETEFADKEAVLANEEVAFVDDEAELNSYDTDDTNGASGTDAVVTEATQSVVAHASHVGGISSHS